MQTSAMKACFQIAECSLSYAKIRTFFSRAYTWFSEDITDILFLSIKIIVILYILHCIYAVLRYSLGVLPVCALKKRTKCCGYSKPRRWLTCVMLRVSSASSWREAESSRSLIILLAVLPVSVLTSSPKYLLE